MKPCPACGKQVQDTDPECFFCGVIFEKWVARSIKPTPVVVSVPAASLESVGFWVRAGAAFIDGLLISLVSKPFQSISTSMHLPITRMWPIIIAFAYYTWTVGEWGQSLGKKLAGIKIIRVGGNRISYSRAFLRELARIPSALLFGIGYLMVPFTQMKQGLHDMLVDTRVIYLPEATPGKRKVMTILGVFPFIAAFFMILTISFVFTRLPTASRTRLSSIISKFSGRSENKGRDFGSLMLRAQEAENKGNLGLLRSQVSIFYGDNLRYPKSLVELSISKQFPQMPTLKLENHSTATEIQVYEDNICLGNNAIDGTKIKDSGKWGYVANPSSPCNGTVFVDCTHNDGKGKPWYGW